MADKINAQEELKYWIVKKRKQKWANILKVGFISNFWESVQNVSFFYEKDVYNNDVEIKNIPPILKNCDIMQCPLYSKCMGGCGYKEYSNKNGF